MVMYKIDRRGGRKMGGWSKNRFLGQNPEPNIDNDKRGLGETLS